MSYSVPTIENVDKLIMEIKEELCKVIRSEENDKNHVQQIAKDCVSMSIVITQKEYDRLKEFYDSSPKDVVASMIKNHAAKISKEYMSVDEFCVIYPFISKTSLQEIVNEYDSYIRDFSVVEGKIVLYNVKKVFDIFENEDIRRPIVAKKYNLWKMSKRMFRL